MTTAANDHLALDFERLQAEAAAGDPDLLDGRRVADALEAQIREVVSALSTRDYTPTLAVVRVGDDPASEIYVEHKTRASERLGIESRHLHRPSDVSQAELVGMLDELSHDAATDGLLLQLPLPEHIDPHTCIEHIHPRKDVDGFHPRNMGCLMAGRGVLEACTPRGIMTLLRAHGVEPRGKNTVVIGRSRTVGRPMAQMLTRADATVTVCHRHTDDLAAEVRRAEILVVATGVPELIDGDWVREGAVVVDVGISREESGSLVGDVEFDEARRHARLISPVPGGVGPMTVATLMENTVRAALYRQNLRWVGEELRPSRDEEGGGRACAEYRD